jgi:hypothetical protein
VPGCHRTDLVTAGINHAQYQRPATKISQFYGSPIDIDQRMVADLVANRGLAYSKCSVVIECRFRTIGSDSFSYWLNTCVGAGQENRM